MKARKHTIYLLSLLLLAAGCRSRQIQGVVTDDKGQPIGQARVILLNHKGDKILEGKNFRDSDWLSVTDSQGRYSLPAPRETAFSIGVSRTNFEPEIRKIKGVTPNPVDFTLQPVRVYSVGNRVRIVDSGWCPGTIIRSGSGEEEGQYKVELDRQPLLKVEVTTSRARIRPLESGTPASPLPCSYFNKHDTP